jgi:hypothetical protein
MSLFHTFAFFILQQKIWHPVVLSRKVYLQVSFSTSLLKLPRLNPLILAVSLSWVPLHAAGSAFVGYRFKGHGLMDWRS